MTVNAALETGRRPLGRVWCSQDRQQLADALTSSDRVGEREVRVDRVVVAPAVSFTRDVARGDQLPHDAVNGPLGDSEVVADVT